MGKVIGFNKGLRSSAPGEVLHSSPWEFRRSHWNSSNFIQILKSQCDKMETMLRAHDRRREEIRGQIPPHFVLKGGTAYTIRAMWGLRGNEGRMKDLYYLAGLMDCVINQVNPLLRTDMLRDVYREIFSMKRRLNVNWYGPLDQVLLPIDPQFYNESEHHALLTGASTLKELYETIRQNTDEMFDVLSLEYAFYCPSVG